MYSLNFIRKDFRKSGLSEEDFEKSFLEELKNKQEEARKKRCVPGTDIVEGGQYGVSHSKTRRPLSYNDVWNIDPDYLLWVYRRGKTDWIREQLLQNIDLVENIQMFFRKYEL